VLQCVAVCCNVLQCVAVCCSVLQCVADSTYSPLVCCVAMCCNVLQCVAACCSVLLITHTVHLRVVFVHAENGGSVRVREREGERIYMSNDAKNTHIQEHTHPRTRTSKLTEHTHPP